MRSAAVYLLSLGLAVIGFAADVPSVNELTETLSRGPWAELPVRAVAAVRHAKEADRKETTIAVVKAALGLNPASATAVVGAIARAVPAMTAVAAETAAAEQPKQAPEIALAAAAANHSAAAAVVAGVCRSVPAQYLSIAVAVDTAVPGSGKEILEAVGTAEPDLRLPISQVVAQYNGYQPSVALILAQAKPGAAGDGADIATANYRPDRPTNTNYHRVDKYPIPVGGFDGEPPFKYHKP
jgi:hypothetical protein